jgi:phage regulator Rha-like protein
MNEFVKLTTQDVSNAIPVISSVFLAEKIEYPHFQITRLIENHIDDFKEFGSIDFESHLLNSKNVKSYLLNESQFILLVTYLRNSKKKTKVMELKKEIVRQFSFMKKELMARSETRHIAKKNRKELTSVIKEVLPEGNFKNFAYGNYTRLIYKKLFGKTVKELKEIYNVKDGGNIRDYFTIEQLEKIQEVESGIATIIEYDNSENEKVVYEKVKKYLDDKKIIK